MDALLVNGDELELTPDPPWSWMAPPVRVKVTATPGHRMKAKGEFVIWESEILMAGMLAVGQLYRAPGFDAPGTVLTVVLTVNPGTMSAAVKDLKLPVGTVKTTGTFMATVVPAMNPSTGSPDPVVVKTGTWAVSSNVQSIASSAQPKAKSTDDEQKGVKGGAAGGSSASEHQAAEQQVHYVAVQLEDADGNKLAAHRVAVSTPDGRREQRVLTASGATRIDGIRLGETLGASDANSNSAADPKNAVVRLLEDALRPPVTRPVLPWIGLTLVDLDGFPLEDVDVELVAPSGATSIHTTSAKGSLRLDKLPTHGDFTFSLPHGLGEAFGIGTGSALGAEHTDSGETGADVHIPSRRLALLELPDSLFRTDSCVVMPTPQEAADEAALQSAEQTTGIAVFGVALRVCDERPHLKLFIAGHTDSVDSVQYNQALSQERADVVRCMLTGDREAYKALVTARHRVSDYKHILRWCTRHVPNVPFTCDPGTVDDVAHTGVEAVRTFQREYTFYKFNLGADTSPDLVEDGSVGPLTWGAIFDVFQYAIARELGETPKTASKLRGSVKWLDPAYPALGFSEHHPIEAIGRDNYASQSNRRAEFLFFDERDILPNLADSQANPAGSDIYLPGIYARDVLRGPGVTPHKEYAAARLPTRFSRGKSFPKPSMLPLLHAVAAQLDEESWRAVMLVGHTDAIGSEDFNNKLSTRRAEAVKALLMRDLDFFLARFDGAQGERWGWEEVQWMLYALRPHGRPFYIGMADEHCGPLTEDAISRFQVWTGTLPPDSALDQATLRELLTRYLELAPLIDRTITAMGAGCFHAPRTFGADSQPLPDEEGVESPDQRRVDVFLHGGSGMSPEVETLATPSPQALAAYTTWCRRATIPLVAPAYEQFVQVVDGLGNPVVADVSLAIVGDGDTDAQSGAFGSARTDTGGVAEVALEAGTYVGALSLHTTATAGSSTTAESTDFHPDESCGMTLHAPSSNRVPRRAN